MASVTNLTINRQSGSDNTHYASWDFKEETTSTSSGVVKVGSLVSINEGATYYNGASIPDWVKSQRWYVSWLKGDRAVIDKSENGKHKINSPINISNITVVGSTESTTVSLNTLDYYEVKWHYDTGNGVWFSGGESNTNEQNATYNAPSNTIKIRVTVTPVSKTRTVNNQETSYWTGTPTSAEYVVAVDPPDTPGTPQVSIEKFKLTALLDNISDARADRIQFQVYNDTTLFNTGTVDVIACRASYACSVNSGGKYRVRCRAVNLYSTSEVYSGWSNFSGDSVTMPGTVSGLICKAISETSVHLEWLAVSNATSYDIEYTTKKDYFDSSDQTVVINSIETTRYEKTGLESGQEYFFRVRATNSGGSSAWSDLVSVIIGKPPAAPTTWSSTTTAIVGEPLTLYWMHNSEDGSSQMYAELELYIGGTKESHVIRSTDENAEKTMQYSVDTSSYNEGIKIQWRVRTAGVTLEYGDWSIQRTVDIYAPPTLTLSVTNSAGETLETLTSFPFYISGSTGPDTQTPIGYHVSITSNSIYSTIDNVGNIQTVNKGEQVYSKYFDTSEQLMLELSAGHIDLENGVTYTITCTVSMNSGLTAEASSTFMVSWINAIYEPDAEISIDSNTLSAYIRPYCKDQEGNLVENVTMSVYRRELDGSFTEIATGVDNSSNTFVTDPHPALDYARYRIVAISNSTGSVSFYDVPGYPIGEKAAVIQWGEAWTNFDTTSEYALEQTPWSGSLLKLPYNLDVSDKLDKDVSLIEYIGRKHPVSYYGTQLGESSTWSVDVVKSDKETVYALRKLSMWTGDVYVREPSGSGYWAHVSVSFSQKHREMTIPVELDITRVEGGV